VKEILERRRQRVADAWALRSEIVLVGAGEPVPFPGGADQTYPFRAHAEYFYLTDHDVPGAVLAFDPGEGWVDFVPEITERDRVWEGPVEREGSPLTGLAAWLGTRRGRAVIGLGSLLPGVRSDAARVAACREAYTHVRRVKDEEELRRIRLAVAATRAGFEAVRHTIRPGVTERAIQIELEAAFFRHGGDRTGYDSIVGTGTNSAVLHFLPTARVVEDGDLVLIDAAAEVRRYVCDVTRTFPASGSFSTLQREIFELVHAVETRAIARCTAGTEYRDVHLGAARDVAEGLVHLGILKGEVDGLVERDAHALFFPHGIGHMVGFGVRDAGGYLPGRAPSSRPGLGMLRTDLPLEPGYVVTIEPGIYFIPALLGSAERREKHRHAVAWDRVDRMLAFGGVRIEDNVLVTTGAPEVLTASIPVMYEPRSPRSASEPE